jgi:hypothetical protein
VAANPVISAAGAMQYAVQVGASTGAPTSIDVGASNTVLAGNTGANPVFRKIVDADIETGADVNGAKLLDNSVAASKLLGDASQSGLRKPFMSVGDEGSVDNLWVVENPGSLSVAWPYAQNRVYINTGASSLRTITITGIGADSIGSEVRLVVTDSDGLKLVAPSGVTIRDGGSVSAAGGYIESTTVGSVVTLQVISTTEIYVVSKNGTWSVT